MSKLILGNCSEVMGRFEDNTIDTIITDPPYGLKFMGKKWDYDIPAMEVFEEMLRVAKPGAFLLCFGGTRTFHRIACNIEDAGWMIRDIIMWLYGSGFPKSNNISKNIDKRMGAKREVVGQREDILKKQGADIKRGYRKIVDSYKAGAPERDCGFKTVSADVTAPATDEAKLWDGWGTALKPAFEPIIVAMKPTAGTFVDNALNWGVAGLNIAGSRIGTEIIKSIGGRKCVVTGDDRKGKALGMNAPHEPLNTIHQGRWPANVILDEEAGRLLDEQSGISKSTGGKGAKSGLFDNPSIYGKFSGEDVGGNAGGLGDKGGASRFFYCAKASKAERNAGCEGLEEKVKTDKYAGMDTRCKVCGKLFLAGNPCTCDPEKHESKSERAMNPKSSNNHPTVKPLKLIEYLCRLTKTPMGGIVLDPYIGSGTTAVACINTGRRFVGIENVKEYYVIAVNRVKHARAKRRKKS